MNITPTQSGASRLACDIVNETFLSLDGFESLRKSIEQRETNGTITFACSIARVIDRVIRESATICDECGGTGEIENGLLFWGQPISVPCGCSKTKTSHERES